MAESISSERRIAWCIPRPIKGGGGFRTITRNARELQRRGFACDFYLTPQSGVLVSDAQLLAEIQDWFGFSPNDVYTSASSLARNASLVVATAWDTVRYASMLDCKNKAYFVQDFEPWFFPMSDNWILAEQTYHHGFHIITIGRWLAKKLSEITGMPCRPTDFCADHDVYFRTNRPRERAVCAIYQPEKMRRAPGLLADSLRLLHEADPSIKVYLYGSSDTTTTIDGAENLGLLPIKECNDLYNRCSCGISMGLSNPSRIPFEMMTAGLPVVDIGRENNFYDLPDSATLLAEPDPASLAAAVLKIVNDRQLAERMSEAGVAFMSDRTVARETIEFADSCESIISGKSDGWEIPETPLIYHSNPENGSENLRSLATSANAAKLGEELLSKRPISCSAPYISISVSNINPSELVELQVASWMEPDQSDLAWTSLENDGEAWTGMIKVPAIPDEPTCLFLHLYARFSKGAEITFIGDVNRLIVSDAYTRQAGGERRDYSTSRFSASIKPLSEMPAPSSAGNVDDPPPQRNGLLSFLRHTRNKA